MEAFGFPAAWMAFLDAHDLHGACFEVPEDADASGLGAELQLLTEAQAREEAEDCYPGISMRADGYVPVGMCLLGSGDPYFIRLPEGQAGPLYRIHHDATEAPGEGGTVRYRADAVAVVLDRCEALLAHRDVSAMQAFRTTEPKDA